MFEEPATYAFEVLSNSPEAVPEASLTLSREFARSSREGRPKSAKELADDYRVSDRTIQSWFKTIAAAYCWIDPGTLKTGSSNKTRYTLLCQELIAQYRASVSELSEDAWIASIHAANPDKVAARSVSAKTRPPESHGESTTPLQVEVMGVDGLSEQQQAQHQALSLRQQATDALNAANQSRLAQLREFFADQRSQHQIDRTQRRAQLEAEAQDEAIEEFLIKQQAKQAVLSQLEQLNSLGKLSIAAISNAPSG